MKWLFLERKIGDSSGSSPSPKEISLVHPHVTLLGNYLLPYLLPMSPAGQRSPILYKYNVVPSIENTMAYVFIEILKPVRLSYEEHRQSIARKDNCEVGSSQGTFPIHLPVDHDWQIITSTASQGNPRSDGSSIDQEQCNTETLYALAFSFVDSLSSRFRSDT